ncbi:MAG: NAD-dependent aldehyde dehydrogenase, partial [Chthonomonadales bacterium]|nr:NAD-dependent aldehyde dehydrogenase [Chthonomonadales bacterium]
MNILSTERRLVSRHPATGETLLEIRADSEEEVEAKVASAKEAAEVWRATPLSDRLTRIRRLHDALARSAEQIAQTLSAETGRPLQESFGAEVIPTLRGLDYLCRQAPSLLKPTRPAGQRTWMLPEPYGVIGIIGTWNYPLFLNVVPLCQALAAGNAVVWKPSELAILCARETQRLLESIGLPPGVVEVIYGGAGAGRALTQAECDKYLFTGGVQTGRTILAELARSGKPSVMELSGNDACIVCADAPLELAARSAVWARISNAGQSCIAPQRFYVDQRVYGPFLQQVKAQLEALQSHELTPLRTASARDRCHRLVRDAIEHGACLLHGGELNPEAPGSFYPPTLLAECEDRFAVMAEDLFGPVIAVCPVRDDQEAVARANANPMALGASVWTEDRRRGELLATQLRVGLVSVNSVLLDAAHPAVSFGGVRASGFGKQRGAQGLEEFVVRKVVVLHRQGGTPRHLFPYLPAAVPLLLATARMRLPGGWRAVRELV